MAGVAALIGWPGLAPVLTLCCSWWVRLLLITGACVIYYWLTAGGVLERAVSTGWTPISRLR